MNETTIYLDLSENIERLFAENNMDISDFLKSKNINGSISYGAYPYQFNVGERDKKIRPILIVAGGITLATVAFSISNLLETIYHRPHFVEYHEIRELRDANGNIVYDDNKTPLFKTVKRQEIIQPNRQMTDYALEANFDSKNGVIIKISSKKK